ncbi:MAG: hypothetical protein EZS28_029846 [Streblomastix strix]|uniref:Uncharacterized protein n=1 Tax=Streblomastix strix TaxID=222440 RepID=A0A5J4UVE0_9EUKA|nr:MAG: hypothetical protein EZS28_029846 [Streblomastix strix]
MQYRGQLILDKSCELYQCEIHGNGGGIYAPINFTTQCTFIIKDAFIHECKALNSTDSSQQYSYSEFGWGLFNGDDGDYDPNPKLIDLHWMKIYNNTADKYRKSLFITIVNFVELCINGTLGEFAKGNYSDTYSDERELEGFPMDLSTSNTSISNEVEPQIKPLEEWWRVLRILKSAQVVVNVSNPDGKLMKDGINIEDDGNASVPLEVIIEEDPEKEDPEKGQDEDKKEGKGLPIGIIAGIAVGALTVVAVIIIIIIVAIFISKKKKTKKQMRFNDPDMRARNLPMEIKYPQNSHSLDAVNKAMENNNW